MSNSPRPSNQPGRASTQSDAPSSKDLGPLQIGAPSQSGLRILFNIFVYLLALPSLLMLGVSFLLG